MCEVELFKIFIFIYKFVYQMKNIIKGGSYLLLIYRV